MGHKKMQLTLKIIEKLLMRSEGCVVFTEMVLEEVHVEGVNSLRLKR